MLLFLVFRCGKIILLSFHKLFIYTTLDMMGQFVRIFYCAFSLSCLLSACAEGMYSSPDSASQVLPKRVWNIAPFPVTMVLTENFMVLGTVRYIRVVGMNFVLRYPDTRKDRLCRSSVYSVWESLLFLV